MGDGGIGVRMLKGSDAEILDLAFSPDGCAVAAGFKYLPVHLWNLESASPVAVRLPAGEVYAGGLQFSSDGRAIGWQGPASRRSYDRDTREYCDIGFAVTRVTHGSFASADGMRVVSQHGMPDFCLVGWRLGEEGWHRKWSVSIADLQIEKPTLSADGGLFAMTVRSALGDRWAENPRKVELWDGESGRVLAASDYQHKYAPTLRFSPDTRQLIGFNDMSLMAWTVPEMGEPRLIRNDSRKDFTAAVYHPSGRRLFATSNDETVQVFDTATWERTGRFTWNIGKLKAIAVSADGLLAAAGSENGSIVIWDID